MTILHADGFPFPSPDDNSLVVRLNLGNTRVLLMGDAQAGDRQDPSVGTVQDRRGKLSEQRRAVTRHFGPGTTVGIPFAAQIGGYGLR